MKKYVEIKNIKKCVENMMKYVETMEKYMVAPSLFLITSWDLGKVLSSTLIYRLL